MSQVQQCPFCQSLKEKIAESKSGFAIRDSFPVSTNHSLIVPKRHVASIFELDSAELAELWELVAIVRYQLIKTGANGVNIGVNDGIAAGQTVQHAHIHVIPRYDGDVEDPRGGVRWVIPSKAKYWD